MTSVALFSRNTHTHTHTDTHGNTLDVVYLHFDISPGLPGPQQAVFHPGTCLQLFPAERKRVDPSAPSEVSGLLSVKCDGPHPHFNIMKLPRRDGTHTHTHTHTHKHARGDTRAHGHRRTAVGIFTGPYLRLLEGFKVLVGNGVHSPLAKPLPPTVIALCFLQPRVTEPAPS